MSRTNHEQSVHRPGSVIFRSLDFGLRSALFAALWWVLNDGSADSWLLGIPVVILALALSISIVPLSRWKLNGYGTLVFGLYFLRKSLLSSIDVASRVLHPSLPLKPGVVHYRLRLTGETARAIMANTTSLLPGTLSIGLEGDTLIVHALDHDAPVIEELQQLEERIAGIYGIRLSEETP